MNSATNITPTHSSLATRLLRAVLAKTALELLVICALVSLAAYWYFNPQLRGAIDVISVQRIAGWTADPRRPGETIEVQLFIDGRFAAVSSAGERRDDLVSAGATAGPFHGFSFAPAALKLAPGSHTAQVYAVRPSAAGSRILVPLSEKTLSFEVR